jgi:uncharacterized protein (DUF1800 family)
VLQPRAHDFGEKTFLGRTGAFGGEEIVAIIMEQPAAARYITRRLFTELANYDPKPETLASLVEVWDRSGHRIDEVVRAILTSAEFNSEKSYRALVRSPVEFVVGAIRGLELEIDLAAALQLRRGSRGREQSHFRAMDQVLFEPHSVAGWPGGANWLSSSTFFARVNFLDQLLFPRGRPLRIPALAGAATAEEMVKLAVDRLIDGQMAQPGREALTATAAAISSLEERAATVAYLVLASPEYQLI